jgi:hypothetical protein
VIDLDRLQRWRHSSPSSTALVQRPRIPGDEPRYRSCGFAARITRRASRVRRAITRASASDAAIASHLARRGEAPVTARRGFRRRYLQSIRASRWPAANSRTEPILTLNLSPKRTRSRRHRLFFGRVGHLHPEQNVGARPSILTSGVKAVPRLFSGVHNSADPTDT